MNNHLKYNLNRVAYFVAIVEEKTITAAAQRLGLSKAVVSKQLQLLEEEVGVNLIVRNTRHMHTTKAGEVFYLQSRDVLNYAQLAYEGLAQISQEPTGTIRITSPIDFGVAKLSAFVANFCQKYPKIQIELSLNDDIVDIVSQGFDLSFRIGWLSDSSNRARKLGTFKEVLVCAPNKANEWYPETPSDLKQLPFAAYYGIDHSARVFTKKNKTNNQIQRTEVQLHSNLTFNVTSALRQALLEGHHFGIMPDFAIQQDLDNGRLIQLLPSWQLREGGIYIVSPPSTLRSQAVKLFISELENRLIVD
ncbi:MULTISPECIES: LysR family transcriptional regulator [Pseudoalteromonas]|uniref:LysR family transcriptional regulator n=1 Tax=Pseudoalteromonas undina TaxID=43660 RepID=A0ACC6QZB7_9GAMM|nr:MULTISPECIES: LysR family transcriptional regulator [unclassified Pseudoalteromonas]KPZ57211.1 HTH-type transcriptional regulator DmlR [Pseudoalteromonas sp. P1-25]KPZ59368.1 HTH-type transcriptional regulator DmlR [Pseudoalteromonas sp. P1-13-1a]